MKKTVGIAFLSLPLIASAQSYGGMDDATMQQMMQQAEKMQACMENIDQAELDAFQKSAEQMQAEVEALCAVGKRDAANGRALKFAQEAASNKAMQQMKKCGEGMQNMLPKIAATAADDSDTQPRHICDVK